jgi:oligopeptide transport system substrate-binding protein
MKRIALFMALMIILSSVDACSEQSGQVADTPAAAAESGVNELIFSLPTRPNLDPHWNAGSTGAYLQSLLYEGLYRYSETGYQLAGATEATTSEDGLTWTFKLREDAKWNDGQPVVAEDYVYSFKRLVNPEVSSVYMFDYGKFIKNGEKIANGELPLDELGVRAVDDYTLEVQLETVCAFFDALCCYTTFFPMRGDKVSEDGVGDWAWNVETSVTNGPMKLVYCDEEQEIILERNDHYWNNANVKLDRLVVKLVDDENTRMSLFTTGAIDLMNSALAEERTNLNEQGFFHSVPALTTNFLLINNKKEQFSDPRVRKALSMVLDREYMANTLLNYTRIAADTYIGAGFPGGTVGQDFHDESGVLVKRDPDAARELLAEAGFPGGEGFPIIEMKYSNASADNTTIFEYLQSVFETELGITSQLIPLEPAAMTSLRDAGDFDITPQGWGADYFDASNMLAIFSPGNLINSGGFENPAFTEAYNASLEEVDNAKRIELLHEAERIFIEEDMGIIPLYYGTNPYVFREDVVTNVKYDANGRLMMLDVIVVR